MESIAGRTIVVIGGTSGIGLATAQAAQAQGADVVITGRDPGRLANALSALDGRARGVALDSADEAGTRTLFEGLARIDHVFVSAGTAGGGGLAGETSALHPQVDTRLWGSVYVAKYAAPRMSRDGSITFCSGVGAQRPRAGASIAAAACGAVEAFGRSLAVELAPLRVNTIVPGLIDTPLLDGLGVDRERFLAGAARSFPVGRVGKPEDIAHAVLFLMQNGFVTGISLVVDGGRLLV